nr:hypothetical protein [uncultured Desulfobacter sp.]
MDTETQKYIYWHKIIESTYPEWSVGNIIGLNREERLLNLFDDKNQNNIKKFAMKLACFGRTEAVSDLKKQQRQLFELCKEKDEEPTEELKRLAAEEGWE